MTEKTCGGCHWYNPDGFEPIRSSAGMWSAEAAAVINRELSQRENAGLCMRTIPTRVTRDFSCPAWTARPGAEAVEGTDGPVYNRGRSEGHADVCASLRAILDPGDRNHWNIDGLLKEVARINGAVDAVSTAWLPGKDAPRDGTWVIGLWGIAIWNAKCIDGLWWDCYDKAIRRQPDFYLPIPQTPEEVKP